MLQHEKSLWIDIVKLLSFDATSNFTDELSCSNIYTPNILKVAREIIDPKKLKHTDESVFDIWNTYVEKIIPHEFLDAIETIYNEEIACDIEDYYFYTQKRAFLANLFNYWIVVFDDYLNKNPDGIILNNEITETINKYLGYITNMEEEVTNTNITSEWDKYINSLYVPDLECSEITYDFIKELLMKYIFIDISYEFWSKLNEMLGEDITNLKEWAIENIGGETEPVVPVINDSTDQED